MTVNQNMYSLIRHIKILCQSQKVQDQMVEDYSHIMGYNNNGQLITCQNMGYDAKLAPTVTIETGMEMPHTIYRIYKIREEMLVSQVVMVSGVQAYKMNYHILFQILERQIFLIPQLIVC